MRKIWIIGKSEFLRRVTSKWFILITLLAPLLMVAMLFVPALVMILGSGSDAATVAVVDETGVLMDRLQAEAGDEFVFVTTPAAGAARDSVLAGAYNGYLVLPESLRRGEGEATYYSVEGGGLTFSSRLGRLVDGAVEAQRLEDRQAPADVLAILDARVDVDMRRLTEGGGEESDATLAYTIVGYVMGFFIYVAVLLYGAFVMNGVIEEKTSRVVEVMVSSVRPFELLMGKVLGIGAMGLVQLTVWAVLIGVGMSFAGAGLALVLDPADFNLPEGASEEAMLQAADVALPTVSPGLFVAFVLFFLGGYLLYASIYAAVGSAVESQQDAQSLMLPIILLIVVPMLFISFVAESPNAPLSVVLSMVPFFSPILMILRMAVTDVPWWEVALSMALLAGGFVASIWVSARIYRVGVLMYGKKPSIKDLAKWVRYA